MKMYLRTIPPEGLVIEKSMPAEDAGLAGSDFHILSPIHLNIKAVKAGDELCVSVKARTLCGYACARCLAEVKKERADAFDIYCDINPKTEFVDISEDIRQELMLAMTSDIVLCGPDCKGICPNCGMNLNEDACRCPKDLKNPVVMRRDDDPEDKPRRLPL
ncbi:MAG TPA: DUF177 domain-containing protein [Candidatus Omnitrophota bacterium]|nr:DUF177 domain-containing protein [Candidatus Omnitrophota bacterium]HPB68999.1 DUF177 domain-containing protein [Candidatus Omnitrophota bacterium]HQO58948.1 DUF177 domain-containing protein [Candidatus Omnitrophota bacterium]HQP11974.1 DUF177 domain-containing protein [Candidatus Omnitrophota bacterium]